MKKKIAIVDFSAGNLWSVERACQYVGLEPTITSDGKVLLASDAAILPGVGAFGDAMANLRKLGLEAPLKEFVASGRPLMGVCLGMQLLFTDSHEFGFNQGLQILDGSVRKFPQGLPPYTHMRVPQIGWNCLLPAQDWTHTPLSGLKAGAFMYFVHSYYVSPQNHEDVLTTTEYEGFEYCSSVRRGNVYGFQFHPEKSGAEGIKIYQQWVAQI